MSKTSRQRAVTRRTARVHESEDYGVQDGFFTAQLILPAIPSFLVPRASPNAATEIKATTAINPTKRAYSMRAAPRSV